MAAQMATAFVETDYAGPHTWQTQGWARLVRRALRRRVYTRWIDRYCQSLTVSGHDNLSGLGGPCIFNANHQSHLDSLVLLTALPDEVKDNFYFDAVADRGRSTTRKPCSQRAATSVSFPKAHGLRTGVWDSFATAWLCWHWSWTFP